MEKAKEVIQFPLPQTERPGFLGLEKYLLQINVPHGKFVLDPIEKVGDSQEFRVVFKFEDLLVVEPEKFIDNMMPNFEKEIRRECLRLLSSVQRKGGKRN